MDGIEQTGNGNKIVQSSTPVGTEVPKHSQPPTDINLLRAGLLENLKDRKDLFNQIISGKFKGNDADADAEKQWKKIFGNDIHVGV